MFTPLTLLNGSRLTNRLAKAAMEENLAARANCPARRCGAYTAIGPKAAPA